MHSTSKSLAFCLVVAALYSVGNSAIANAQDTRAAPEQASGVTKKKLVRANRLMIATANPLASEAGRNILAAGGSAIDAAIAAQMVLTLTEPQSSGIGGGAFLLHWNKTDKTLNTYDGRETAPSAAKPDHFMNSDGTRMNFFRASFGGLSVGTPGLLRMLYQAHKKHGKLPWHTLFAPAIIHATDGFKISPRLNALLKNSKPEKFGPEAREYFYDTSGSPFPTGHTLKNPALAQVFTQISKSGPDAFYEGEIAKNIVDKVKAPIGSAGDLSLQDLKKYVSKERPPVCITYKGHTICGMGPPSSGALTVAQTMKLIEPFDLGQKPLNARALHLIAEAQKLAFADRKRYMADPDFVRVPAGLLNDNYLHERRKLLSATKAMPKAEPGNPPLTKRSFFGKDETIENKGTSHLSIVDADGNAISLTTTIESAFGANIMTNGFLLNNQLTDFSFRPVDKNGTPIANRVEPNKRPRSSMSPTMVFDRQGDLIMITGSPGGSRIIPYVIKTLIAHLDWKLDAQEAASLANFGNRGGPLEIEKGMFPDETIEALRKFGHTVRPVTMTSGIQIITIRDEILEGGADPRREGVALGE